MAATPERAVTPEALGGTFAITEAQKQAMIDNLQLEITERARKLRAQYALQAQGLRTRLEMRVNRIPHALRKANMQELVDKYSQPPRSEHPTTTATSTVAASVPIPRPALNHTTSNNSIARGVKRPSDIFHVSDKENENPSGAQLDNPKKRAKTAGPSEKVPAGGKRVPSRKPVPGQVLSPKSQNSRSYPQPPISKASPTKTFVPRPTSPVKPTIAAQAAAAKQARPASRQIKRQPPAATAAPPVPKKDAEPKPSEKRSSSASDSTTGTTIVKKTAPKSSTVAAARKAATAAPATTVPTTTKSAAAPKKTGGIKAAIQSLTGSKKGRAAKAAEAEAVTKTTTGNTTVVGGRSLRKRGSMSPASKAASTKSKVYSITTTTKFTKPSTKVTTVSVIIKNAVPANGSSSNMKSTHEVTPAPTQKRTSSMTSKTTKGSKGRVSSAGAVKKLGSKRIGKVVEKGKEWLRGSRKK